MDEIKNLKRLINLSDDEKSELEGNEVKFIDLAKKLVQSYNHFENEKVKVGRMKTLLENVTYKINFSYNELFRTSAEIKDELVPSTESDLTISENLLKEIEEFVSKNSSKKEI